LPLLAAVAHAEMLRDEVPIRRATRLAAVASFGRAIMTRTPSAIPTVHDTAATAVRAD